MGRSSTARQRLLVGGKVNRFIPNPTFDPVGKPGALDEYFRGRNPRGADLNALFGELEPIRPAYRDRDARLALMDEQGMQGAILLPTLGVGMEQALLPDLDAAAATFRAFNRWMDDDWGFAYKERIFARPLHHAVQARQRGARTGVGAGARRAVHRDDPRTDHDRRRHACARRPDVRRLLAAGQRFGHHRLLPLAARRTTRSSCPHGASRTT